MGILQKIYRRIRPIEQAFDYGNETCHYNDCTSKQVEDHVFCEDHLLDGIFG